MTSPNSRERALRTHMRNDLAAWAAFVLRPQGQAPAAHHMAMMSALEDVARGDTKRLMLLLPPGSAKSTYSSLIFPAWWMARNPGGAVICASHTASLAHHFGRGVRNLLTEHGGRLGVGVRRDARAAGQFLTDRGGEYFAIGVQGGVTGRRADLVVMDDPIRSHTHAESVYAREQLWNWFRSDLATRLKPNGGMILVMTRWHRDDLASRLAAQGGWNTVRLPAFAEADDPLGRMPGDALWPDWEDYDALLAKRTLLGERTFAAMFQQSPLQDKGKLFDTRAMATVGAAPEGVAVRAWDLAAGADASRDPDWSAGVRLMRDGRGGFVVEDVRRVRANADDVAALIRDVAREDGVQVTVGLPRDPGQAGVYQIACLTRMLAGFRVTSSAERGPKAVRATGLAAQIEAGNVRMVRASWNQVLLDELDAFPDGAKDDQVDALSRAFAMLTGTTEPARFADLPVFAR